MFLWCLGASPRRAVRAEDAGAALCAPPAVPRNYLAAPLAAPLGEITAAVLAAASEATAATTTTATARRRRRVLALAGKGDWGPGTGKTALTAVMCADDAVRTAFDDEIYCVSVGDLDVIGLLSVQLSLLDALSAGSGDSGGGGCEGSAGMSHLVSADKSADPADNAQAAEAIARALGFRRRASAAPQKPDDHPLPLLYICPARGRLSGRVRRRLTSFPAAPAFYPPNSPTGAS